MSSSERRNRPHNDHLSDTELNELVDDNLTPVEKARAEEHLATCAECAERFHTLRATISALHAAPSVMPRRSFRLSSEQAKIPEKPPTRFDRISHWLVPELAVIRAATLLVALLLVSVTAVDIAIHRSNNGENAGPVLMQSFPGPENTEPAGQTGESITSSQPPLMGANNAGGPVEDNSATENIEPSSRTSNVGTAEPALFGVSQTEATEPSGFAAAPAPAAQSAEEASPVSTPVLAGSPTTETTISNPPGRAAHHVSRWRIAEFGLLVLLIWLLGSLAGRMRMGDHPNPENPDSQE